MISLVSNNYDKSNYRKHYNDSKRWLNGFN